VCTVSHPIKDLIAKRTWQIKKADDSSNTTAIFCQKILKLVDECGRYSKPNKCYFRYAAWLKRPNFWGHVSPGSAETLARGGGITNHHLIAYSLSNISAKNYQNWLMCVVFVVFWYTVYYESLNILGIWLIKTRIHVPKMGFFCVAWCPRLGAILTRHQKAHHCTKLRL